jgi:APA family basic amino acid/polyamine antiporter
MLTAPRVYFAMAEDKLFFRSVGKLNPKTQVPVVAIVLQGVMAVAIALWGGYEQILNYVVSVDFIFFGATAACIFVFRRRAGRFQTTANESTGSFARVPGHPVTTALFVTICWLVVINTVYKYPENTLIGLAILLAGIPAFYFWRSRNNR